MSIILPTKKVSIERANPKRLIIYSKPKAGKTTAYSLLEDNLILDLENESYSYLHEDGKFIWNEDCEVHICIVRN